MLQTGNYYFYFPNHLSSRKFRQKKFPFLEKTKKGIIKKLVKVDEFFLVTHSEKWTLSFDDLGPEYSAEFKNWYKFEILNLGTELQGFIVDEVKIYDENNNLVYPGEENYSDEEIEEIYFPSGILELFYDRGILRPGNIPDHLIKSLDFGLIE